MTNGFEIFERAGRGSVHGMGYPAVGFTRNAFVFNELALRALSVTLGDELTVLFHRGSGLVAFEQPGKGYAPSQSAKLGKTAGKTSGAQIALGQFLRWAGIDRKAKEPFQIYRLGFDESSELHMFRLPRGSWEKPEGVNVVIQEDGDGAVSATRKRLRSARGGDANGKPSAQKRKDLPATSPHRQP